VFDHLGPQQGEGKQQEGKAAKHEEMEEKEDDPMDTTTEASGMAAAVSTEDETLPMEVDPSEPPQVTTSDEGDINRSSKGITQGEPGKLSSTVHTQQATEETTGSDKLISSGQPEVSEVVSQTVSGDVSSS
jgi:hypothetical protein